MNSSSPRRPRGPRTVRVPAGLGCLVALVALPLALFAALLGLVRALLGLLLGEPRRTAASPGPYPGAAPQAATDLGEFVRKMSLDDSFDVEDARTAGIPIDRGVTAESLIADGIARGWIERRGERYAVTARGRTESAALLRRAGV